MSKSRAQHLEEYLEWAERVQPHELKFLGRSQELVDRLDKEPEAAADTEPAELTTGG